MRWKLQNRRMADCVSHRAVLPAATPCFGPSAMWSLGKTRPMEGLTQRPAGLTAATAKQTPSVEDAFFHVACAGLRCLTRMSLGPSRHRSSAKQAPRIPTALLAAANSSSGCCTAAPSYVVSSMGPTGSSASALRRFPGRLTS